MYKTFSFNIDQHSPKNILANLLLLTKNYIYASVLHSNSSTEKYQIIAAFSNSTKSSSYTDVSLTNKWHFGYLSYDLKNKIENLQSTHPDFFDVPDSLFFEPEFLIRLQNGTVLIDGASEIFSEADAQAIFQRITTTTI